MIENSFKSEKAKAMIHILKDTEYLCDFSLETDKSLVTDDLQAGCLTDYTRKLIAESKVLDNKTRVLPILADSSVAQSHWLSVKYLVQQKKRRN